MSYRDDLAALEARVHSLRGELAETEKLAADARRLVSNYLERSDVNAADRPFLLTALGTIAQRSNNRKEELKNHSLNPILHKWNMEVQNISQPLLS